MQVYVVGGAVRDRLLGLDVRDRDHVVVGATPEEMTALGFQPVGKDFPVFLHPRTHEEYALARTERKTARGYKGFQVYATPDVTLEEDLRRRDLTINAMAENEAGELFDPYGGRADLAARVFRHVSEAFPEDPVRILRVARFAARFGEFSVAPETLGLMQAMAANGEVDALVPERVWQELSRGLMESRPSRMFLLLRECGALAKLLPELDTLFGVPQNPKSHPEIDTGDHVMRVIDQAAADSTALPVRYAALLHDLGKGLTPPENWPNHGGHEAAGLELVKQVGQRLRAPADCAGLAQIVARWHGQAHNADKMGAAGLLDLLEQTDAFRRPERFGEFLQACAADFHGRPGWEARPFSQAERLRRALTAARQVDAGAVAQQSAPAEIPRAIHDARLRAIAGAVLKV
ncbi:MAG: multifunctional CCA tRNA nucleotidyl transferase/2'3'-cyclic phosphodiesterase/2'nucleotidase/phosphatase [Hydrogenophilales bacterium 28-61-23]|nr:MAG: multifunctional CCA tRNA nucleotidyl transferase/2'3'-cyclic phosphodiesterase/2'nucleotidase/phosphatase [Hydrogenophilales bacterium 28-61-23]